MQDRSPPNRRNPLATHGRTIHSGQFRPDSFTRAMSAPPLQADIKADVISHLPFAVCEELLNSPEIISLILGAEICIPPHTEC